MPFGAALDTALGVVLARRYVQRRLRRLSTSHPPSRCRRCVRQLRDEDACGLSSASEPALRTQAAAAPASQSTSAAQSFPKTAPELYGPRRLDRVRRAKGDQLGRDNVPFNVVTVRVAAVAGAALLVLAGLVVFRVTPAVERSFNCEDGIGDLVGVGSVLVMIAGAIITILGFRQAVAAQSLSSALVAFAGVALILLSFTGLYLYTQTWGVEGCMD